MPFEKESYSLEKSSLEVDPCEKIEHDHQITTISEDTTEVINTKTPKRKQNPLLAFFYLSLFVITYGLFSVIVKKLSYMSPTQLTFVRNAGIFMGSLPIAVASKENILGKKKDRISLLGRGLLGAFGLHLHVLAFALLPLADAAIILSIVPVVTIIFARIHLRESCSLIQSVCVGITLCGVFLSARLPELLQKRSDFQFDYNYISGLAAAVGCVIFLSLVFVILRKMKDVHFTIPMLYFGFFGMIENVTISGIMLSYSPPDCGWDQFLYVSITFLSFSGNSALTLAFQLQEAGILAVQRSSLEIIVAMVNQIIFFKQYPDLYNIGGGFLVIISLSILGIRNWLLSLPENSETKIKLRYLLL